MAELKEITLEYKHAIAGHLQWIQQNQGAIRILPHVQALYGGTQIDDKIIGTIVSIAFSNKPFSLDRPIVGFASAEGAVKVSARGTQDLVRRGLNLGKVMKEVSERFGGTGGGHNIAAGAQIPAGKEDEFLGSVEEMVAKTVVGVKL